MSERDMYTLLPLLPQFMQLEVAKYVQLNDKKARLAARLMLLQCLRDDGNSDLIHHWFRDEHEKPWIRGWHPFCISHSVNIVLFSWSDEIAGIDIEKNASYKFEEMLDVLHPKETQLIEESSQQLECFLDIWVKKESFLKAVGIGIMEGLNRYDCSGSWVECQDRYWYFHRLVVDPSYSGYVCTSQKGVSIQVHRIDSFFNSTKPVLTHCLRSCYHCDICHYRN